MNNVTRTWLGGSNRQANNAANWSPAHAPKPGDSLVMAPGSTIDINNDALKGDTLAIRGNPGPDLNSVINLSGARVPMSLAADGANGASPYGGDIIVNLAANTKWIGGAAIGPYGGNRVPFSLLPPSLTIQGDQNAVWANTNSMIDNNVKVAVPVTGEGTISLYSAHHDAVMEFTSSVGAGQNLSVGGYAEYGGEYGKVVVDSPAIFKPSITLGFGEIVLQGLQASSYGYANDMLTLYGGNGQPIDTVKLTIAANYGDSFNGPMDFGVSQVGSNVVVHADGASYADGGYLLPLHI